MLEKDIDKNSIFYREGRPDLVHYAVANEGVDNKFLLIGDSHGLKLSYRFQQLFKESRVKGNLDNFPTIIAIINFGILSNKDQWHDLQFIREFVAEHKIPRILIANHFLPKWCEHMDFLEGNQATCDM